MAAETSSLLLSLPAEILDMIIPLCIDDVTLEEVITKCSTFHSLRLCCHAMKDFVESPQRLAHFFPREMYIESCLISPEALQTLPTFQSSGSIKTDEGIVLIRHILRNLEESGAVRNITGFHIYSLPAVQLPEFDTKEWSDFLSRMTRFRVTIETLRNPKHPRRVADGDTDEEEEPRYGVNPLVLNYEEDDEIANNRFERFRQQVLSWPSKLVNVEWLLLEFKYPERESRFRSFFGDPNTMPNLKFLIIKGCVFGREFTDWLDAHVDVMTSIWFNKAGPVEKLQGLQEDEQEEMAWEDVNRSLVKMHRLDMVRAVEAYMDCKGHYQYTAEGGREVEEIVRRNEKDD